MKAGDKVVCIKDGGTSQHPSIPEAIKGEIYTIFSFGASHPDTHVCLEEFGPMYAYKKTLFRLVDESFGEVVCEILEKQIEHDKVLEGQQG